MAGEVFYPDGTPVPKEKLSEAIAGGTARWRKGDVLRFQAPTGEGYEVPAESAYDAFQRGWTLESPEEAELKDARKKATVADVLGAGGRGIAQSLSFGLYGAVDPEGVKRSEYIAPGAYGAGEVLGLISPAVVEGAAAKGLGAAGRVAEGALDVGRVVTAPARGVSRAARGVGEAAAGLLPESATVSRAVVSHGISGGIEAGTFGIGQELGREIGEKEDLSLERLLSAGGEAAVLGLGVGGTLGGAGAGVSKLGRKIGTAVGKVAPLDKTINKLEFRSVGGSASDVVRMGEDRYNLFLKEAREPTVPGMRPVLRPTVAEALKTDLPTKAQDIAENREVLGRAIRDLHESQSAVIGPLPVQEELINGRIAPLAVEDSATLLRGQAPLGKLVDNGASPDGFAVKQMLLEPAEAQIRDLHLKGYIAEANRLNEALQPFRAAKSLAEFHDADTALRQLIQDKNTEGFVKGQARELRKNTRDALLNVIDTLDPDAGARLRYLNERYGAFADMARISNKAALKQSQQGLPVNPWDVGILATGVLGASPLGVAFGVTKIGYQALKSSDQVAAGAARALSALTKTSTAQGAVVKSALKDAAFRRSVAAIAPRGSQLAKDFADRQQKAGELDTQPQVVAARVGREVDPIAQVKPALARKMTSTILDDLRWLSTKRPQPVTMPPAVRGKKDEPALTAPASKAAEFVRASKALGDPVAEIKKLSEKKFPSPETNQVLQERRPELLKDVESNLYDMQVDLAKKGKRLSYDLRVEASMLTGKPYDVTMTPEYVKAAQDVWAKKRAATAQPSFPSPRRQTEREVRSRLDRFKTSAEDLQELPEKGSR